jgi:CheY-like chemotaxis protein
MTGEIIPLIEDNPSDVELTRHAFEKALEVLSRLRADERTRRMPIVVLTSSRQDEDIAASYDPGADISPPSVK